jgi:hypothetical protein
MHLAADQGRARLVADSTWAKMVADSVWARLVANTPWTDMAIHSCGVCLGDHRRILKHTASYERVYHFSRIAVTASFSSSPTVQKLARFLDVSGVLGINAPISSPLYTTRRFSFV